MSEDLGGDPACWMHLFEAAQSDGTPRAGVVADLGTIDIAGPSGAIWSLPHGGDLDANLVRLDGDRTIARHVNDEVDVLLVVLTGHGEIRVDGEVHRLYGDVLVSVPKGVPRSITAGPRGITYLSLHRRREGLQVTSPDEALRTGGRRRR